MDDRSEKIITLAREMLRSTPVAEPPRSHISMSFKMLCLTTLIAALGGSLITQVTIEQASPINHYERTELDALVFYTAHLKGIDESIVRQQVTSRLGISHFDEINRRDFEAVRLYLQKLAQ